MKIDIKTVLTICTLLAGILGSYYATKEHTNTQVARLEERLAAQEKVLNEVHTQLNALTVALAAKGVIR